MKVCTDCKNIWPNHYNLSYSHCKVAREDYSSDGVDSFGLCRELNRSGQCPSFEQAESPVKTTSWDYLKALIS